jgi:filamentous hemagglutinin family protein
MNHHGSMNRLYRLVWSQVRSAWVPVAETAKGRGKSGHARAMAGRNALAAAISLVLAPLAHASPAASPCVALVCGVTAVSATNRPLGGQVVSGSASITQLGNVTDIRQSSPDLIIDWLSFNVGSQATVDFLQPSASSVAVNRIAGTNGSEILGHLDANGQVYLINPNGIVFARGAQVNVGGLVASTLDVSDSAPGASAQSFAGNGTGSIVNQGTIAAANGGYVALLGNRVSNQGVITAQLGTVALGAGSAVTLDFSGNRLIHLQVDQSTLNNLAANNQLIQADGGLVIMTAGAQRALLASVVNNSGIIEARTVDNHDGTIELLGGMTAGTVNVAGMLDASAAEGGNGGFIETSAGHVEVTDDAKITTAAARGLTGSWLVDPQDFTIAPSGGDITGAALSSELGTTSVTLQSSSGATAGSGNINVDDTVSWSAHTLTLTAANNIDVNAVMTATGSASLALNPSTANGSNAAVPGGTVVTGLNGSGFTGMVNFSGTGALSINGTTFTVINSLGAQGSTTGTDLQGMEGNLSGNYALGSDINAAATSTWRGGAGFAPVEEFNGTFEGLGHTISSLTIRPSSSDVGLFGEVGSTGIVRNVGLVGGSVSGYYIVGALVGLNYGTIRDSYTTGNVSGLAFVGGLVGDNLLTISNTYATGSVSGSSSVGGLVGANAYGSSVLNSYATGSVSVGSIVGGLVGYNDGTVSNSYSSGPVSGSSNVGGLMGENTGAVSNSYSTGQVAGSSSVGGLTGVNTGTITASYWNVTTSGQSSSAGGIGISTANMQNEVNFASATSANGNVNPNWDFTNTWVMYSGYTFPLLRSLMTPITVTANNAAMTYDKQPYSGGNGVTYSTTPNANLLGTVNYGGTSQGAINAGSYSIAPSSLYSNQQGYIISYANGTLTVNPLSLIGASIDAGNSIYGSAVTPGAVSFGNVIAGDLVTSTASIVSPLYSTSGHLDAGGYAQTASTLSGADAGNYTFAGYTTPTPNYTVNPLTLIGASIAAGNSIYGSAVTPGAVSFGNVIAGDLVTSTASIASPTYSTSKNLNAGGYAQTASTLSGADAGNYTFAGYTTPTANYTVAQLALTVTGLTATNRVYNGGTADALGGAPSIAPIGGDVVSLSSSGSGSFSDRNVANGKAVTVSGYTLSGADAGNYTLVEPSGLSANITQLASVDWTGGATGNWSSALNWAGGAIPDLSNVAAITIPKGASVTYDAGMAGLGTTVLTSLTSSGAVLMAAGALETTGTFSTSGFSQTGGVLTAGTLKITSTSARGVELGDLVAGTLSVTSKGGSIAELGGASVHVTGTTILAAENGTTYYGITLANAANDFTGPITATGSNIDLESGTGNLTLASTTATGTLTLTALAGSVAQAKGKLIDVTGPVTADSSAITLDSSAALTADVTSPGAVSLTAAGPLEVLGSIGTNLTTVTTGSGSTTFGNTTVGEKLIVTSPGTISQTASTSLVVNGAITLSAGSDSAITLINTGNTFTGKVTATGDGISLYDAGALNAVLNSSGNASVQSASTIAKALTLSGTVAGGLATTSAGGTVFGAIIVGPSSPTGTPVLLNITSPGAVSVIAGDAVTVGGAPASTTVANPYVEVNGEQDTKLR